MDPVGDRPESAASPAVRGIPAQLPSVTMAGKARSHGGGRQSASAVTVARASGVKAGVALGERTGAVAGPGRVADWSRPRRRG